MIPNYSSDDMLRLADAWHEAAGKDLSSNEAQNLYETTKNAFTHLQNLEYSLNYLTNNECIPVAAKMLDLSNAFIKGFNKHGVNESINLAFWVAEHSGLERLRYGRIIKYQGAYNSLHDLFKLVESVKENYDPCNNPKNRGTDISILKLVDSTSKFFIKDWRKTEIPNHNDIKQAIFSYLDLENLMSMRSTSQQNKEIVNELLIQAMNGGKISFEDLGIYGFDHIITFFGEQASKLMTIDLNLIASDDDDKVAQIIRRFPNIPYVTLNEGVKVTDKFLENLKSMKALKDLDFNKFNDAEAFNSIINHCPHLVAVSLTDFDTIKDISILNNCKELKELHLTNCPNLDANLTLNKDCPLKALALTECSIKHINCPSLTILHIIDSPLESIACPELHTVDLRNCPVKDEILKNSIHLNSLTLVDCDVAKISLQRNRDLKKVEFRNCMLTSIVFLRELSQINSLAIENCPISSINVIKYFPLLEEFEIIGCTDVTDIAVLLNCPSLKKVKLAVDLPENDVQAAVEYENILLALIERGVEVTDY